MTLSYDGTFGGSEQQMHVMTDGGGAGSGWPSADAAASAEQAAAQIEQGASPLQAAIDASNWTRGDVELAVEIGSTVAVLVLTWVALQEGRR